MSWFFMNVPATVVIFSLWVGIPLWIVFRYPHRAGHAEPLRLEARLEDDALAGEPAGSWAGPTGAPTAPLTDVNGGGDAAGPVWGSPAPGTVTARSR
jgi:hypothetical protein